MSDLKNSLHFSLYETESFGGMFSRQKNNVEMLNLSVVMVMLSLVHNIDKKVFYYLTHLDCCQLLKLLICVYFSYSL